MNNICGCTKPSPDEKPKRKLEDGLAKKILLVAVWDKAAQINHGHFVVSKYP